MAKRARERARQERQEAKRQRRQSALDAADDNAKDIPNESELMEEFRVLSERHAEGLLGDEPYAQERHRIFVELGIETEEDA